jgi:hypothetical protein
MKSYKNILNTKPKQSIRQLEEEFGQSCDYFSAGKSDIGRFLKFHPVRAAYPYDAALEPVQRS